MAFETNRYINGQWTTRRADPLAALQYAEKVDKEATVGDQDIEKAPEIGYLTQTVIRSPLVHWILPARLRDPTRNDVAFIGDDFVQIKELRHDMHLWDVARKENFGARIRNARVIGSNKPSAKVGGDFGSDFLKQEDMDTVMSTDEDHGTNDLPKQFIVLQLDTGDTVFLMLREFEDGRLQFVSSRLRVPKSMLKLQPGLHLAVDPSSRYMAIGCSEQLFTLYALNPRNELSRQFAQDLPLRHVQAQTTLVVSGVIMKMEFLHPSQDDEDHVLLLVIYMARDKARMQLYEWVAGVDIKSIGPAHRKGYPLDRYKKLPLLIIPLTIRSSFIIMYEGEHSMSICHGIMEGPPSFSNIVLPADLPTHLHHGKGVPLWVSWGRPIRHDKFLELRDDIYLVREDGVLKFLEISRKVDEFLDTYVPVGQLETNCGSALAVLDYQDHRQINNKSGDMLITGGDSCSGGTYLIKAKAEPSFTEPIHNWSPSPDFVTTYKPQEVAPLDESEHLRHRRNFVSIPDRIFACAGKGSKGVITEFRYGLEAKLGFEMDYGSPITDIWVLDPTHDTMSEHDEASLFLLSLSNSSAVLRVCEDAGEVTNLRPTETVFDLKYRTIAASTQMHSTIQVTERSIMLINGTQAHVYEEAEILNVSENGVIVGRGLEIGKVAIDEGSILFTIGFNGSNYLQIIERNDRNDTETNGVPDVDTKSKVRTLGKYFGHLSCLSACRISNVLYAIIAETRGNSMLLIFESVLDTSRRELEISLNSHAEFELDAFVSIFIASQTLITLTLLCGTRNGILVTLNIDVSTFDVSSSRYDRLGFSQVLLKRGVQPDVADMLFASCDSKICLLEPNNLSKASPSGDGAYGRLAINQVWITDAKNQGLRQPAIVSVARLGPNISNSSDGRLLFVAGTQLLLTAFSSQAKPVPRHIPIRGTPSRIIYSQTLRLLVVGAIIEGKTALLFIDPDTGDNLSAPSERGTSQRADYISGLGKSNEKIYHLLEWSFTKEGKTWTFFIVATSSGRLLIVDFKREDPRQSETVTINGMDMEFAGKVVFWTKYRFAEAAAIYSVTGFSDGLLWCSGNDLFCFTLDTKEKKFKPLARYELPSPALALTYDDGKIYANTNSHSLEILDLKIRSDRAEIIRTHGDEVTRNTFHHAYIQRDPGRSIHLVSDKRCSIAGLWATQDTKADTLKTVFEAELPHSVLKFRPGRCRPIWDSSWTGQRTRSTFSTVSKNADDDVGSIDRPELLGLSIDGSLSIHTLLEMSAWKFLRFLIDLAIRSPRVCEFTYRDDAVPLDPRTKPKVMMHVDGDILKRCLDGRFLEELLRIGQGTEDAHQIFCKFLELQQELHQGTLVRDAGAEFYVAQAYIDLDYYLRPAL